MFAIALWDRRDHTLYLVRDRLGEKPLYYGWNRGVFLFGSELKALQAHPTFNSEIDRNALTLYFRHSCVPAPHTIFKGISKVSPGTIVSIRALQGSHKIHIQSYWSFRECVVEGIEGSSRLTPDESIAELGTLLRDAVALRMQADVPLGAMLSGGVDSSTIVALMQAQSSRKVKTFTIGFSDPLYNEAPQALAVANHLGTDHTELYVTPKNVMDVIPSLPKLYDEPFADSSQIPTFLISQLAKKSVTVALSGDAGDELFGGYSRYAIGNKLWTTISRIPHGISRKVASVIRLLSPEIWSTVYSGARWLLPQGLKYQNIGEKLHTIADLLPMTAQDKVYLTLVSHWMHPNELVINGKEPTTLVSSSWTDLPPTEFIHRMMFLDTITYLPDDILAKVDRATMGVSLEGRIPFLDHRVVELSWRLPLEVKLREQQSKWILRQVLYKYVPRGLIERPKMGFGIPLGKWLRGPLKEWAEDLLSTSRIEKQGLLRVEPIRSKWKEHLLGKKNWQYLLWDVLMFQAWMARNN